MMMDFAVMPGFMVLQRLAQPAQQRPGCADFDAERLLQIEQVSIEADDHFGLCRQGTGQSWVVFEIATAALAQGRRFDQPNCVAVPAQHWPWVMRNTAARSQALRSATNLVKNRLAGVSKNAAASECREAKVRFTSPASPCHDDVGVQDDLHFRLLRTRFCATRISRTSFSVNSGASAMFLSRNATSWSIRACRCCRSSSRKYSLSVLKPRFSASSLANEANSLLSEMLCVIVFTIENLAAHWSLSMFNDPLTILKSG